MSWERMTPVSPSATGKTFWSLISSRRDSRWTSAPATTARKRSRLGSDTLCAPGLDGLGDLAGLQAARADVLAAGRRAHEDPHLLEVRIEASPSGHHRVAPAVAEGGLLAAGDTHLCHAGRKCSGRRARVAS